MLEAYAVSDPGCIRPNNEDYFISDTDAGIFILADGMGGANGGEYASHISAELLYESLREFPRDGESSIQTAFSQANTAVREAARENPELDGMGTTLLAVRSTGDARFEIASVGDSRAYLASRGELSLLTEDQTWVAEVGSRLGLSDEALRKHPMRHVLTMAIGTAEELRIFFREVKLVSGDQLLLCSDGLHGVISERILSETLDSAKTLSEKCHSLIDAAKGAGGPDNVTVVLIQLV